jgi:hypothetical protein
MSHTRSIMFSAVEITFTLHFEIPRNKVKLMLIFINIVTHRPTIARQRPQHTRAQQDRSGVFCGPRSDRC